MKQDEQYGPRATFHDVSIITARFDLGRVGIAKDLGGAFNLNLLLNTSRGKYVLRLYRPWVTTARLAYQHAIRRMLSRAGFPVPQPLPALTGETFMYYNDRLLEIEPFILHDGVADTWERNVMAFAILGRLHAVFAAKTARIPLVDPVVTNYGTPDLLLTWTQRAANKITQSSQDVQAQEKVGRPQGSPLPSPAPAPTFLAEALALYAEAIRLLTSLQTWWQDNQPRLPRQITHGDYGGDNLLFWQGQVVAILDFDLVGIRERVYELAYTLYWWLKKQGQGQIAAVNAWPRVRELIASYNQQVHRRLARAELRALPLEMACVPLYWIAETDLLPNPAREVMQHADKLADARWLIEHRDELADLFLHNTPGAREIVAPYQER